MGLDTLIEQYVKDRDRAVTLSIQNDTLEPFKKFVEKYKRLGFYPPCFELPADDVLRISINKMAIHSINITPEIQNKAINWLLDNGYDLLLE